MQGKKTKKTKKTRKKHVFFPKKTRNEKNVFFHNPSWVHHFHIVSVSSRTDLLLMVSHQSLLLIDFRLCPNCQKKKQHLIIFWSLRSEGHFISYIHPFYVTIKDVNLHKDQDHHDYELCLIIAKARGACCKTVQSTVFTEFKNLHDWRQCGKNGQS